MLIYPTQLFTRSLILQHVMATTFEVPLTPKIPNVSTMAADAVAEVVSRVPISGDEVELDQLLREMKEDQLGAFQLGEDGVMRSFNADRDILDAVGLKPNQIRIWFQRMPPSLRELLGQDQYEGIDGTTVPREKMFQRDRNLLPPPMSKEEQERRKIQLKEIADKARQDEEKKKKEAEKRLKKLSKRKNKKEFKKEEGPRRGEERAEEDSVDEVEKRKSTEKQKGAFVKEIEAKDDAEGSSGAGESQMKNFEANVKEIEAKA